MLSGRPDLARDAADEASLRVACALEGYTWDYLRFVREEGVWGPAASVFPGWPTRAAEITLLDPCCGSGHFLTEALKALAILRRRRGGAGISRQRRCLRAARQSARARDRWPVRSDCGLRAGADGQEDRRAGNELPTPACRLRRRRRLCRNGICCARRWGCRFATRVGGAALSIRPSAAPRQSDRGRGRRFGQPDAHRAH